MESEYDYFKNLYSSSKGFEKDDILKDIVVSTKQLTKSDFDKIENIPWIIDAFGSLSIQSIKKLPYIPSSNKLSDFLFNFVGTHVHPFDLDGGTPSMDSNFSYAIMLKYSILADSLFICQFPRFAIKESADKTNAYPSEITINIPSQSNAYKLILKMEGLTKRPF